MATVVPKTSFLPPVNDYQTFVRTPTGFVATGVPLKYYQPTAYYSPRYFDGRYVRYGGVDAASPILRYDSDLTANGYRYAYETANNIVAEEQARTDDGTNAQGFYEYVGDDGIKYRVDYTADENGFRAAVSYFF